jgi:hypothetical protein
MITFRATAVAASALLALSTPSSGQSPPSPAAAAKGARTVSVSGSGVDQLTTAIVHSRKPTATGSVQSSTEIVELTGDLRGRVLYHVTTVTDTVRRTLVNTGHQVFSGTIGGSLPVMIHDDRFRFDVELATGRETGKVFLLDHVAGPRVRCTLDVAGTGMNAERNPTFTYTGECVFAGDGR